MLQHVWERASQARYLTSVTIATDDERIRAAAEKFHARVVMTRDDHPSGTDRVAEVASASKRMSIVNIQGDEPLIDPVAIDAAVLGLMEDDEVPMGTLKKRIERPDEITNPNVVKVVTDLSGQRDLFFPRADSSCANGRRDAGLFQTYRVVCVSARFPARLFGSAGGAAGTGGDGWSSCGRSKTGSRSAWWKRSTNRWAWIRRRTGRGFRRCSKT